MVKKIDEMFEVNGKLEHIVVQYLLAKETFFVGNALQEGKCYLHNPKLFDNRILHLSIYLFF